MIIRTFYIALMMGLAALGAAALVPSQTTPDRAPDLEALLPGAFGEWAPVPIAAVVLPAQAEPGPGEATAYRAWRDRAGRVITLVAAYGPPLGDSVRLHRPETCYRAQGYSVANRRTRTLEAGVGQPALITIDTQKALRREAVTYWLREGDNYVLNAPGHELSFLTGGGAKEARDGALVRISSRGAARDAISLHDQFLTDFAAALSPEARALLMAPS